MSKSFSFVFLVPGDKVLVVHRRLYEGDQARFFVGTVDGFNEDNGLLKVTGFTYCPTKSGKRFARKKDPRTKILSLTSGTLMVYQLTLDASIDHIEMSQRPDGSLWLVSQGKPFMDLSEISEEK